MVHYKYKDVEMLLAAGIIVRGFRKYVDDLSYIRTNWTHVYADNLSMRIERAIQNHLGASYPKDLRKTLDRIIEIRPTTGRYLAFLMTEINSHFSDEEAISILKFLGYDRYIANVVEYDQQSLVNLVLTFQSGMTRGLRRLIIGQGINSALIDRILEHATVFQNVQQMQKKMTKEGHIPPREACKEIQQIYDEVMLICKIGTVFYEEEPEKRNQFIFASVVQSLHAAGSSHQAKSSNDE